MLNHQDYSDRIRHSLQVILNDERFRSSPQMSAFLNYIVEQTLDGQANRIKAYTIAVDALGKPENFDPQSNPSVRVLAKRLRDTLDQFYADKRKEIDIRILIKPGSYIPQFEVGNPAPVKHAQKPVRPALLPSGTGGRPSGMLSWLQTWHRQVTVLSVTLMAVMAWSLTDTPADQALAVKAPVSKEAELYSTDIASLEHISPSDGRPQLPRLTLVNDDSDTDARLIGDALQKTLQHYDHLIIGRYDSRQASPSAHWPEEYELHYSRKNATTVDLSLMHVQTGKILQRNQLKIPVTEHHQKQLGTGQIKTIHAFGTQLLKNDGIILQDYRERGTLTPVMRCVFLFDDYYADKTRTKRKAAETCAADLHASGAASAIPTVL
ncbi:MAG: hypothetical protein KDJ38_19675 [Gammaproteobacteria bacterium]|nr:hypothetical protein [Gammaproteobacteria bacterium]